jgi:serine/threonine-protein kinase HipA
MKPPVSLVTVYWEGSDNPIPLGRLALKERQIFFEYQPEFLQKGLDISPFYLPLKPGVQRCQERLFEGLFGVFNDSLPDGWGRLLLDRKLMQGGTSPSDLTPLDRLCYVGRQGMGALTYEAAGLVVQAASLTDLDVLSEASMQLQAGENLALLETLLEMNGSSAGARPKVLLAVAGEEWLIKFRSFVDPVDMGAIEYAYHLMAAQAGLEVPEATLFPSKRGCGYFGVKRFDRREGKRVHMHTLSGLLQADHRLPSLDYETVLKATLWLTKEAGECERQFRAAVFNVLSHNRDDHAKNVSFLMGEAGVWRVSPAYDLTFSSGPGGEHSTTVMGEGKRPTRLHLLKLADVMSLRHSKARTLIEEVQQGVSNWQTAAREAGVSQASQQHIQGTLDRVAQEVFFG